MLNKLLPLYQVSQIRAKEQAAYAAGMSHKQLMTQAAQAVFDAIDQRWPDSQSWLLICGAGHNGGDGWVVARMAASSGRAVHVLTVVPVDSLSDLVAEVAQEACEAGVNWSTWGPLDYDADLLIDAMIGIGLNGMPNDAHLEMMARINAAPQPTIAIDCPSGLMADTGVAPSGAIRADMTVTLLGRKVGLYTGMGPALSGEIVCDDLGVSHDGVDAYYQPLDVPSVPPRPANSHKGLFGHVWVVGGHRGMGGAALLAARAALGTGAGKVTVSLDPAYEPAVIAVSPSVMTFAFDDYRDQGVIPVHVNVLVLGPGMGQSTLSDEEWTRLLSHELHYVLDADALHYLRINPAPLPASAVITPHPGEAARLLDTDTQSIQSDRLAAAKALSERYHAVCVLKGAGTVVASMDRPEPWICSQDHPALAKAGFGDVLSGVIAALLAQGLAPWEAATTAVALHARTADRLSQQMPIHAVMPEHVMEHIA